MAITPTDVHAFWFGQLDARGKADGRHTQSWWTKDDAFDREVAERFGSAIDDALAGRLDGWTATPTGALALIILLDQLTRNAFRGTPRSFAGDARAYEVAAAVVGRGDDRALAPDERAFLYMPYMHREELDEQDRAVALFRTLLEVDPSASNAVDYALRHRDVIARFGRFPHRNPILGRPSTAAELEYLAQPGAGF